MLAIFSRPVPKCVCMWRGGGRCGGLSHGPPEISRPFITFQNKKVYPEDYDGDCELERHDKNRVTKTGVRSRVLKQKLTNYLNSDSSSSTPVTQMDVDTNYYGFENLTTPVPCSPVPRFNIDTPKDAPTDVVRKPSPAVISAPRPIFETPLEKPVKRFKRKRVARVRRGNNEVSEQIMYWGQTKQKSVSGNKLRKIYISR